MIAANLFHWSIFQFQAFVLILMRVAPILFMMPVLSGATIPNLIKVGLAFMVTLILLPVVPMNPEGFPGGPYEFVLLGIGELILGFLLSFSVKLIFAGVQLAGELAAYQMGLAMANIMDPQSGMNSTLIAEFGYLIGLLIFLVVDGHHWFFKALVQSFSVISPGGIHLQTGLLQYFVKISGEMFVIAVKLTAPIMAVLVFTQIALGMIAKTVPQMNILITSFPLTIGLGFFFLGLSFDLFWPYLRNLIAQAGQGMVYTLLPLMR
jgi:flagellar biosynthesis protein FliR